MTKVTKFPNTALASELFLVSVNESCLYEIAKAYIRNLQRKVKRQIYDHDKAIDLWSYFADICARNYAANFGLKADPATRRAAAIMFRDYYDEEVRQQGN